MARLVIASKSAWYPPIRREHALARLASRRGHPVRFIEKPLDIRALGCRRGRAWAGGFSRPTPGTERSPIDVIPRSTLVPGHLNRFSEALDVRLLARLIGEQTDPPATIVATLPWHWPAVSGRPRHRRVLDVADDWSALIPGRSHRVRELYARAAAEADAIIVVSERLSALFEGRSVAVVRNGVDESVLTPALTEPPDARRLVYAGTLSERFDAPLADRLLDRLPGWSLELFGGCAYAHLRDRPGADLSRLLARPDGRARWHGPVAKVRLAAALDAADVLLLPNRAGHNVGQDSMKIYDYAARGRPVVATVAATEGISELSPHIWLGSDADALAELVREALDEPPEWGQERADWAAAQSWQSRWPEWSSALFGCASDSPVDPITGERADRDYLAHLP